MTVCSSVCLSEKQEKHSAALKQSKMTLQSYMLLNSQDNCFNFNLKWQFQLVKIRDTQLKCNLAMTVFLFSDVVTFYRNGTTKIVGLPYTMLYSDMAIITIGKHNGNYYQGHIASIEFYTVLLTNEELQKNFENSPQWLKSLC